MGLVDVLSVQKKILGLDHLWVVAHLDHLIPQIQTHYSEFALALAVHFEVGERNGLADISNLNAHLFAAHYLVSLEIIVFLCPEFGQIRHFSVKMDGMGEELVLRTEVGVLDLPEVLRLGQCFVDLSLWFVGLDGPVPF